MSVTLYSDNTMLLGGVVRYYTSVLDKTGTEVESAVLTAVLMDKNYNPVESEFWPMTVRYNTEIGQYEATLPSDVANALSNSSKYILQFRIEYNGLLETAYDDVSVARRTL